jgi:putative colanic acid biosynthesis UDP-glucose lipid carrier transferase
MLVSNAETAKQAFVKEHPHTVPVILRGLDLVAICGAGWLAYYSWYGNLAFNLQYKMTITLGTLLAVLFFELAEIYRPQRTHTFASQVWLIFQAAAATMLVMFGIVKHWIPEFSLDSNSRLIINWGLLSLCSVAGSRALIAVLMRWLRRNGRGQGRVVIVGLSEMALSASARLNASPWAGLQIVGYVDDRAEPRFDETGISLNRLGAVEDLPAIVRNENVDQVWVCYSLKDEERTQQVVDILKHETVNIRLVIDCYSFKAAPLSGALNNVAGIPTLDISVSPLDGINRYVKEIEDRVLAFLFLVLLAPLMALIALGVKLSSPGPVFYRQERVGWNNCRFMMLKFRSMPVNAEAKSGPVWAKPNENRATPFGAFLRKTSLDELPQLINVLKGEMSLVGPRPERPQFVDRFKDQVPNYMKKHMVKAGITGWAQVNGWRGDTDLNKRIEHDLYYIQNWSLWFDLLIAMKTVYSGMVNKNAY